MFKIFRFPSDTNAQLFRAIVGEFVPCQVVDSDVVFYDEAYGDFYAHESTVAEAVHEHGGWEINP